MKKTLMLFLTALLFAQNIFALDLSGGTSSWRTSWLRDALRFSIYPECDQKYTKKDDLADCEKWVKKFNTNFFFIIDRLNEMEAAISSNDSSIDNAAIINNTVRIELLTDADNSHESNIITNDSRIEVLEQVEHSDGAGIKTYPTYANGILIGNSILRNNIDGRIIVDLEVNPTFHRAELMANGKIINLSAGFSTVFYYSLPDCNGIIYSFVYTPWNEPFEFIFNDTKGRFFDHNSSLYYFNINPPLYKNINYQSYASGQQNSEAPYTCNNSIGTTSSTRILTSLTPNDPNITGIFAYPFSTPIVFDGLSQVIPTTP